MSAVCEGCGKENPKMQCPTCKSMGLPPSYFCEQACFKSSWAGHKAKHTSCCIATMTPTEMGFFNFTGPLRPAKISPRRPVPANIARPDYATDPDGRSACEENEKSHKIPRWHGEELAKIRRTCRLAREVLDAGTAAVRVGVTTDEIDRVVHEACVERGAYPSPLNYYNFPKSVCTSVNEVICHGIPDGRELQEGDIVDLDVTIFREGVHGDLNETVFVGRPDADSVKLVHCAFECLMAGIGAVATDNLYRGIGDAIQARADQSGCSVVQTYSGHGIGTKFHTIPSVPHYGNNKAAGVMQPGHVFTIEPMINLGTWKDETWPDKWTSVTKDGKRSAQFEQTLVIGPDGKPEILTDWADSTPTYMKQLDQWGIAPTV